MIEQIKSFDGAWKMVRDLSVLRTLFSECSRAIAAIGDETRQAIILTLMEGPVEGMRVGPITAQVNLSSPAVSHHLKVLKDAGIIAVHKQGTMNYYYLNPDKIAVTNMLTLCQGILEEMAQCDEPGFDTLIRKAAKK